MEDRTELNRLKAELEVLRAEQKKLDKKANKANRESGKHSFLVADAEKAVAEEEKRIWLIENPYPQEEIDAIHAEYDYATERFAHYDNMREEGRTLGEWKRAQLVSSYYRIQQVLAERAEEMGITL